MFARRYVLLQSPGLFEGAPQALEWAKQQLSLEEDDVVKLAAFLPVLNPQERVTFLNLVLGKTAISSVRINGMLNELLQGLHDESAPLTAMQSDKLLRQANKRNLLVPTKLRQRCYELCRKGISRDVFISGVPFMEEGMSPEAVMKHFSDIQSSRHDTNRNIRDIHNFLTGVGGSIHSSDFSKVAKLIADIYEERPFVILPTLHRPLIVMLHQAKVPPDHSLVRDMLTEAVDSLKQSYHKPTEFEKILSRGLEYSVSLGQRDKVLGARLLQLSLLATKKHYHLLEKVPLSSHAVSNLCSSLGTNTSAQMIAEARQIFLHPTMLRAIDTLEYSGAGVKALIALSNRYIHKSPEFMRALMRRYDAMMLGRGGVPPENWNIGARFQIMTALSWADQEMQPREDILLEEFQREINNVTLTDLRHFLNYYHLNKYKIGFRDPLLAVVWTRVVTGANDAPHEFLPEVTKMLMLEFTLGHKGVPFPQLYTWVRPVCKKLYDVTNVMLKEGGSTPDPRSWPSLVRAFVVLSYYETHPKNSNKGEHDVFLDLLRELFRKLFSENDIENFSIWKYPDYGNVVTSYAQLIVSDYGQVRRRGFLKDDAFILKHCFDKLWVFRDDVKRYRRLRDRLLGAFFQIGSHWAPELSKYLGEA